MAITIDEVASLLVRMVEDRKALEFELKAANEEAKNLRAELEVMKAIHGGSK